MFQKFDTYFLNGSLQTKVTNDINLFLQFSKDVLFKEFFDFIIKLKCLLLFKFLFHLKLFFVYSKFLIIKLLHIVVNMVSLNWTITLIHWTNTLLNLGIHRKVSIESSNIFPIYHPNLVLKTSMHTGGGGERAEGVTSCTPYKDFWKTST